MPRIKQPKEVPGRAFALPDNAGLGLWMVAVFTEQGAWLWSETGLLMEEAKRRVAEFKYRLHPPGDGRLSKREE
jgi:hypothetical protein